MASEAKDLVANKPIGRYWTNTSSPKKQKTSSTELSGISFAYFLFNFDIIF